MVFQQPEVSRPKVITTESTGSAQGAYGQQANLNPNANLGSAQQGMGGQGMGLDSVHSSTFKKPTLQEESGGNNILLLTVLASIILVVLIVMLNRRGKAMVMPISDDFDTKIDACVWYPNRRSGGPKH